MSRIGWVIGILVVVLLVLVLAGGGMMWSGGMMGGYGMGGMMGRFGGGGFGFNPLGPILMLLFWLLVIGGVILFVVWIARNAGRTTMATRAGLPGVETPLDIVKARYARGEITKEQYDVLKRDLES